MPQGPLGDRGKALEEQFFARQDAALVEQLRARQRAEGARDSLAAALGVDQAAVPDELIALDLDPESVTAVSMVPLIVVAWADGRIDDKERSAILAAAAQVGIDSGSATHELLAGWLQREPPRALLDAWKGYVTAICDSLGVEARQELQSDVVGRARAVAEAAGGLLGLVGKVSEQEERALREIEGAFSQNAG